MEKIKWISVKDRLPEPGTRFLAYAREYAIADYDTMYTLNLEFYEIWSGYRLDDVTHWMPLPDPPEKD